MGSAQLLLPRIKPEENRRNDDQQATDGIDQQLRVGTTTGVRPGTGHRQYGTQVQHKSRQAQQDDCEQQHENQKAFAVVEGGDQLTCHR
ncbi:hypothetical protein D3C80_1511560 [compost metagenome]